MHIIISQPVSLNRLLYILIHKLYKTLQLQNDSKTHEMIKPTCMHLFLQQNIDSFC